MRVCYVCIKTENKRHKKKCNSYIIFSSTPFTFSQSIFNKPWLQLCAHSLEIWNTNNTQSIDAYLFSVYFVCFSFYCCGNSEQCQFKLNQPQEKSHRRNKNWSNKNENLSNDWKELRFDRNHGTSIGTKASIQCEKFACAFHIVYHPIFEYNASHTRNE